jgi:predicted homoserine dehydrogenase-like protein
MVDAQRRTRVGIVGSGFISQRLVSTFERFRDFELSSVLTRRPRESYGAFARAELLTDSLEQFLEKAEIVVECCNDVIHATDVVDKALSLSRPVVTLDSAFHVTVGSYFVGRGYLTEAEGDQPGALAVLHREALDMGFEPLAYASVKGFLNPDPSRDEMDHWAQRQSISTASVVAFTDGTKLHLEQALVANGLGLGMRVGGLQGLRINDLASATMTLAELATASGFPIVEYVLSPSFPHPHGVFIVARHDDRMRATFEYYKMGRGPYYPLVCHHLYTHLELFKALRRVQRGEAPLLDNSPVPRFSVAAIAKRE